MKRTDPYILVQGPAWGDAQFYGQWLQAAANGCRRQQRFKIDCGIPRADRPALKAVMARQGKVVFGDPPPTKTWPPCRSDDLNPAATKCKHCGSDIGRVSP